MLNTKQFGLVIVCLALSPICSPCSVSSGGVVTRCQCVIIFNNYPAVTRGSVLTPPLIALHLNRPGPDTAARILDSQLINFLIPRASYLLSNSYEKIQS